MVIDLKLAVIDKPYKVEILKSTYTNNGALALFSRIKSDNPEEDGEEFMTFSTNLPQSGSLPKNQFFFKTWSENDGALEQLQAAGIVRSLDQSAQTGFCSAPLVELVADVPEFKPE